jgi:hypothetical protein
MPKTIVQKVKLIAGSREKDGAASRLLSCKELTASEMGTGNLIKAYPIVNAIPRIITKNWMASVIITPRMPPRAV